MATVKRDYYEVLGVERAASGAELKTAYRKLAMEFHPDRNQGDKQAEERFKEVGEAYSVLSDPQKRQRYDAFGHAANGMPDLGGFSFDSAFDLFDMFFGGGGRRRQTGPQPGADLRMNVDISFEESVFGASRTVEVPRKGTCPDCSGSGAAPGTQAAQCPDCGGSGQVRRSVQSIFGQMVNVSACPRCHGEGRIVEQPCPTCRGQGRVDERQKLDITIPPGVDEDVTLRYAGQGEAGPRGGHRGDLYVGFRIAPHPAPGPARPGPPLRAGGQRAAGGAGRSDHGADRQRPARGRRAGGDPARQGPQDRGHGGAARAQRPSR